MDYFFLFVLLLFSIVLALVLVLASYFLVLRKYDYEKLSVYECGFDPFGDARNKFDVKFYLVAILFIIFDLEVMFVFPWAIQISFSSLFSYFIMILFLTILTVGFVYEWCRGALDW